MCVIHRNKKSLIGSCTVAAGEGGGEQPLHCTAETETEGEGEGEGDGEKQ